MINVNPKVTDDLWRKPAAFVTVQAPARFYRLTLAQARQLAEELKAAADQAEAQLKDVVSQQ